MVPNAVVVLQGQLGLEALQQLTPRADGSFEFPSVPKGKHNLCVHAPASRVLNPCVWNPEEAGVEASLLSIVKNVTVKKAGLIRVRLTDNNNLVVPASGGPATSFQVGVWTKKGLFYPLVSMPAETPKGRILELAVPYGEALRIGFLGKAVNAKLGTETVNSATWRQDAFEIAKTGTGIVELPVEITGLAQ